VFDIIDYLTSGTQYKTPQKLPPQQRSTLYQATPHRTYTPITTAFSIVSCQTVLDTVSFATIQH